MGGELFNLSDLILGEMKEHNQELLNPIIPLLWKLSPRKWGNGSQSLCQKAPCQYYIVISAYSRDFHAVWQLLDQR